MKKDSLLQNMNLRKQMAARRAASGFTLVELLVVIAITTILLGLLFGPIISSFNLTRRARAVALAQDAARFGLERMSRELSQATYIYDDAGSGVVLPIFYENVPTQAGNTTIGAALTDNNRFVKWPRLQNARIDLVQPATRQIAGDIIDPTTGQPVGGPELQPGVRGRRVVRYFLALRYPTNPDGTQRLYSNLYEFTSGARNLNPVILYRAEFDPRDPNLFDLDDADYRNSAVNSGGFNDPNFFYSIKGTDPNQRDSKGNPPNGRTYGENWRAIAQPVLVSENMDLIRWNRVGAATNRTEKDINNPFTPTVSFAPVSVVADVANASTLTSGGVETPAAVPTVYQAKYGAWTYPYKITVLRGSTNYNPQSATPRVPEPFGQMTFTVERDQDGTIGIRNGAGDISSTGTLSITPNTDIYSVYSPTTHKLFVKTPNLTFQVDTDRGRIETALPPLMGARTSGVGIPNYQRAGDNAIVPVPITNAGGYLVAALGEMIPVEFRVDSQYPRGGLGTVPTNLGLFSADLFANNYIAPNAAGAGALASPLTVFGNTTGGAQLRGVRILPGTERVIAPISTSTDGTTAVLATWVRVPGTSYPEQPDSKYDPAANTFTVVPERRPIYKFDYDLFPTAANQPLTQVLQFTESATFDFNALAGNPLGESGVAAGDTPGRQFLSVSYLWQNNFSRNMDPASTEWGKPLDATGEEIDVASGERPEADIFRVDYATRQQYTISLGARIYDPTDGKVQSLRVSDKVIINNVIR